MTSWRTRKKIGFALVVCGILVIVLGVVIGQLLSSKIQSEITKLSCVDSKDHAQYEKWVGPSTSENFIYHWHIANKEDFLYKGATPKFEERGPYVYSEETKKIDVEFYDDKHQVSYKSFKKQTFDSKRTAELCKGCKENDTLSVFNSAYLGILELSKGADNFGKAFIPLAVSVLISQLSSNETLAFELLAKNESNMSNLPNSKTFNPMFGSWVQSAGYGAAFLHVPFTPEQMRAFYGILRNSSRLGPPQSETVLKKCSTVSPCLPECGFMLCLGGYYLYSQQNPNSSAPLQAALSNYLCPAESSACFNLTQPAPQLAVLVQFVLNVLPAYVHHFMDAQNYGLVTTRPQSDLALGYVINLPMPGHPKGLTVPGGLTNHNSEKIASDKASETTFYTCKSSETKQYQWAKYNGSDEVNQAFFPGATVEQRKVRGYARQFPGTKKLEACNAAYSARHKSYEMFLPSMFIHVNIAHKKSLEVEGLTMNRYELNERNLEADGVFVQKKGLFDVRRVLALPAYMSLPRFLGGDPELRKKWNISQAEKDKHGIFVDIEPVSGTVMNAKFRVQFNVGLNNVSVPSNASTFREFNIKGLNNSAPFSHVFPVFWVEAGGKIGAEDANEFKSQVFGFLRVGCALLVTFVLIGGICFIIGVLLILLAYKKTQTDVSDISTDE